MKKLKIILFAFLAVLAVVLVVLGLWQKDNIKAVVDSKRYTTTELENKIEDNKEKMEKVVKETQYIDIRSALDAEEESALKKGLITPEDAKLLVRGQATLDELLNKSTPDDTQASTEPAPKPDDSKKQESAGQTEQNPQDTMSDNVSDIIAELYVKKSDFIGKLESLGSQAYSEFVAAGKNKASIPGIIEKYSTTAGGLETQCDSEVNALLVQLESELVAGGQDTALVNEIRQYYYNEKALTKSYYLSKLN